MEPRNTAQQPPLKANLPALPVRAWLLLRRLLYRPPHSAPVGRPEPAAWPSDRLTLACLGHSTVLANFYGVTLLTDPALLERAGLQIPLLGTLGPRRQAPAALAPEELPAPQVILISHAHRDHLDPATLRRLPGKAAAVFAPVSAAAALRRCGFADVRVLEPGGTAEAAGLRVTAFETNHPAGSLPWQTARGGCLGYLVEKNGRKAFFSGDSALTGFPEALRAAAPDVAVLGIGGYAPFLNAHATPEQAWAMSRELNARYLLPVHWGGFKLSEEPFGEPLERLLAAAGREDWRVAVRGLGQTFTLPEDGKHAAS